MDKPSFAATQERVLRIVERVAPNHNVDVERDLRDLGLESMVLMSIAFRIEKEFDVDLRTLGAELAEQRSVSQLATFLQRVLSERA
ncbi:MAG TPA: acyl carrier protein [Polyangiaceae bacterium]|jgi:acyl carrier protein|nr:acyl carrier protein [Polyangiaceae bacterium]